MGLGNVKTRRPVLWIMGAVLAASATLVFVITPVKAESPNAVDLFGEDMNISPIGAGEVGWAPTVGGHVSIWQNATVTGTVVTTEPVGEVELYASGDQCEGAPRAVVVINGAEVMSEAVESTAWTNYVARTSLPAGMHTVEIRYFSDHYVDPTCDRNLMVDKLSLIPTSIPGELLFADRFNRNVDPALRWDAVLRAAANRITTSTNYVRAGGRSAKFTTLDEDVAPLTPSENPRAQLNKEAFFCEGDERWIGWSMYFPNNYPDLPSYGWTVHGSIGTAPPYDGNNATAAFVLDNALPGNRLMIESLSQDDGSNIIWQGAMRRGDWYDWVFHIRFSRNDEEGFIEIWENGQKQVLSNGQTKLFYRTLDQDTDPHCGNLQVTNYFKKGMVDRLTMYHDEIRVGTSHAAVIP